MRAFDVHALDYLLKPFDDTRFAQALARARKHLSKDVSKLRTQLDQLVQSLNDQQTNPTSGRLAERLAVKKGSESILINVEEVDWIEADANYVVLHVGEESYMARSTLTGMERDLDPHRFVRVHRSAIVNVDGIERLSPAGHGDYRIHLRSGLELALSRHYQRQLHSVIRCFS